ncbi:alpha-amylase [Apiospora kogelbergensis]|uniref:alpha-amylase n=1 Tax=Apiospora kogelbergensis TaxID=1337665 RepID=UPI0031315158
MGKFVGNKSGNADFNLADVDFSHPEVQRNVINWGSWIAKELKLKGFRFDGCLHFSQDFGKYSMFHVGDFWSSDVKEMLEYLDFMESRYSLFDSPLLHNFSRLSTTERSDL